MHRPGAARHGALLRSPLVCLLPQCFSRILAHAPSGCRSAGCRWAARKDIILTQAPSTACARRCGRKGCAASLEAWAPPWPASARATPSVSEIQGGLHMASPEIPSSRWVWLGSQAKALCGALRSPRVRSRLLMPPHLPRPLQTSAPISCCGAGCQASRPTKRQQPAAAAAAADSRRRAACWRHWRMRGRP